MGDSAKGNRKSVAIVDIGAIGQGPARSSIATSGKGPARSSIAASSRKSERKSVRFGGEPSGADSWSKMDDDDDLTPERERAESVRFRALTLSLKKPKTEDEKAEELARSYTLAARKAMRSGPQSSLKTGAEGVARTLSLRKPVQQRPIRELDAKTIELDLKLLCNRWDVCFDPGGGIESPEELLERHRMMRSEVNALKAKHCNALHASRRARVSSSVCDWPPREPWPPRPHPITPSLPRRS